MNSWESEMNVNDTSSDSDTQDKNCSISCFSMLIIITIIIYYYVESCDSGYLCRFAYQLEYSY